MSHLFRVAFWRKPLADNHSSPCSSHSTPRTLVLFDLLMIGIGGTVGSGVFATAGIIASLYAGPAAILSWILAGFGCILSGFAFMELACRIPSAGSTYAYTYHTLGELPALLAGSLLTLEYGVSSAGGARSWSDKLTTWMYHTFQYKGPSFLKSDESVVDLYAALLMTLCVSVVLCGMRIGKIVINTITLIKITVVLFIILAGLTRFQLNHLNPFVPERVSIDGTAQFGWSGVLLGASASFFGYIGYDEVCCLAGEAKDPQKNIPRAVIGTIIGAALLSTFATVSLIGMQSYTEIDVKESFGMAFESVGYGTAAEIVYIGEILTMPATIFIGFLAQPRVQFAMAQDGLLHPVFAQVDAHGNLTKGTQICGVIAIAIAMFVPFQVLWSFISLGILIAFNMTNTALLFARSDIGSSAVERRRRKIMIVVYVLCAFVAAFCWERVMRMNELDRLEGKMHVWTRFEKDLAVFWTVIVVVLVVILYRVMKVPSHCNSPVAFELQCGTESDRHGNVSDCHRSDKDCHGNENDFHWSESDCHGSESDCHGSESDRHGSESDRHGSESEAQGFRAPFVPLTPCVAIFFNWFLFCQMETYAMLLIAVWFLLAFVCYLSYSMHHGLAHHHFAYKQLQKQEPKP